MDDVRHDVLQPIGNVFGLDLIYNIAQSNESKMRNSNILLAFGNESQ